MIKYSPVKSLKYHNIKYYYHLVSITIQTKIVAILLYTTLFIETTMDIYAKVTDKKKQESMEHLSHKLDVF